MEIPFGISGPDQFCPYCKRILLEIHDDGTFDLYPDASLTISNSTVIIEDEDDIESETDIEAVCLRPKCKIKGIIGSAIRA